MARKLRPVDCFLLYALQQKWWLFPRLLHCWPYAEHFDLSGTCFLPQTLQSICWVLPFADFFFPSFFFFRKNFSFFFSTALTSWRFCICFNWLRQLLQSLELYSASNLGLVAKALSRCYQQFQARCGQVSMNLSILKIHKRLPCFV